MSVVNKFNVNKEQVTLDADIIENMSANDVSYNSSLQYNENTVGDKLSELNKQMIYDVTANNDGIIFTSLSALLSDENLSTLIPTSFRHGGMTICFVQSSDNKYVQYRLMGQSFTTNITQWQGVDDEPTEGSDNLVKSGGVYNSVNQLFKNMFLYAGNIYKTGKIIIDNTDIYVRTPYIKIDRDNDIIVKDIYETNSYASLAFFDKDFNFILWTDNDTGTQDNTNGAKSFTLPTNLIPTNAVYFVAQGRGDYEPDKSVENGVVTLNSIVFGDITNITKSTSSLNIRVDDLSSNISQKLKMGNIFLCFGGVTKNGSISYLSDSEYVNTPLIRIDRDSDIYVKNIFETPSKYAPLVFFDKDLNFVSWTDNAEGGQTGTSGLKTFVLPKSLIPTNAVYFAATGRRDYESDKKVENGELDVSRILVASYIKEQKNFDNITNLEDRLSILEQNHSNEIKEIADRYDSVITKRELYLRQKYHHDGIGKWYGVHWVEDNDAHNVTDIYSDGDSTLCDTLPIQNKMRRCVVNNGKVKYYLNQENSLYKEDGITLAILDGTDGNVMVEIPEFFYKAEVSLNESNQRIIDLKISEYGIDGFNYSPKCYCSIGFATIDRDNGTLSSVITALFSVTEQEITITSETDYSAGTGYSLGIQKLVQRTGFSSNAAKYRGGNQLSTEKMLDPISGNQVTCDYWDNETNPNQPSFCLNKLGNGISKVKRSECRNQAKMWVGETMYLYDVQKALFILSTVEFKTRNIQDAININSPREGGLGKGATVYPDYNAYEGFFAYRGNACIPNGVTLCLGNHSGEVYYKMPQVPTSYNDSVFGNYKDVYMPVMSYRGIENYYGHLNSCADQITLKCISDGTSGGANVDYYYQRNPFKCSTDISNYEHIGTFNFKPTIMPISELIFGFDCHILPQKTLDNQNYSNAYCDCSELNTSNSEMMAISYNGRLVSGKLPGRNFIVSMWGDDVMANRASESTRLCAFIL